MEIRKAVLNDTEALCPLLTEFFAYNSELQPMYCNAAIGDSEYPKSIIESDDSDFLVAVVEGIIVGFIHINVMKTPPYNAVVPHNYAEIMAFMVTEKNRNAGIGLNLINYAKQWCKDRNLEYIELTSLSNAEEANSFYNKNNFTTVSHIRRCIL